MTQPVHESSQSRDRVWHRHGTVTRPRLGFLGVGWIGRDRLEAIERSGVAEVAAVCDPAVDGTVPFEELLGLDGIVIATPSALHAEQAIAALEAGAAVFCQKPLARDAPEAQRVVDAARAADRLLEVDLSYRHAEAFRAALAEPIGELLAADLVFHNAYGPDKAWFFDPRLSGGGCVIDLGIHLVDLALQIAGRPERVEARLHGSPVETYATAQLDRVRLACSWNLHAGRDAAIEANFYGTDGGVSVTNVGGSFYDFRCDRFRGTERETLVEPPDAWGGRAAVAWAERLARGERFDPAADELVLLHETIDRIYACAS
jgi:predicted dehydrogenase